jgi:hypothetical protein
MFRKRKVCDTPLTRGGFRHYDYDRMLVWKWHAQFRSAAMDDLDNGKASITTSPVRAFCGTFKSGLGEGERPSVER